MSSSRRPILVHPLSWRSRHWRSVVGLVVLIFVARLISGWHARRVLNAQLDEIRARGEPATLADLKFDAVPDAENAWALQTKAGKISMGSGVWSPSSSNDEYREFPPFPGNWMKRAAASEAAHGQVFALARQARQLSRVRLRQGFTRPAMVGAMLPTLNTTRNLANTLKDGSLYSHVRGDDVEAVERVRDLLHVTRSLQADPILVSQLVATGIVATTIHAAQIMAPGLRMEKPGTRQAVRGLIADLLDESADWRGFEASLRGERVLVGDYNEWAVGRGWFLRPVADMESVRQGRRFAAMIEVASVRNWPQASAMVDRIPVEGSPNNAIPAGRRPPPNVPRYSRFLRLDGYSVRASVLTHFRVIADRRMTAVSLAAQLYRADRGRWPSRLDELVPEYLPAVPADPYRADGRPLSYVVAKLPPPLVGDRPLVYSEDKDRPTGIKAEPMYGFQVVSSGSSPSAGHPAQYRDLSRFEPPASPEAVNGDPQKPDAPGAEPEKDDPAKKP
jgi:hypothetical protein